MAEYMFLILILISYVIDAAAYHRVPSSDRANKTLTVFKPSSKQELTNAIDGCIQEKISCDTENEGLMGSWDVSDLFNDDILAWDVSSVTNMRAMFNGASSFNRDISKWNVSSVTNMGFMFNGALSFNRDISKWDVSSVTDMGSMFSGASSFNKGISKWDVASVTFMGSMFYGASSFNKDISKWDVASVTNMGLMFYHASSFNRNISKWDVASVINMGSMFSGALSFNQTLCGAWSESKAFRVGMFKRSAGRIGDDKACPDTGTQAIDTQITTVTQPAVFKPSSKRELAYAIDECKKKKRKIKKK